MPSEKILLRDGTWKKKKSWRERRTVAAIPSYRTTTNRLTYDEPSFANPLTGDQEASNDCISSSTAMIDRWKEPLKAVGKQRRDERACYK